MAKLTTVTNNLKSLSRFMQVFDGSFPSGMFVHSFGLEPHIIKDEVKCAKTLKIYLENLVHDQYYKMEYVLIKKVYKALDEEKLSLIKKLDNEYGSFLTYEYAKASKDLGYNYYIQTKNLVENDIVKSYFNLIENKKVQCNELVLLSCLAYDFGLRLEDFIIIWTKKNLINIAMTSLKISRIKPSQIQKILFDLDDFISSFEYESIDEKITNFNPLFEEVIFAHKNLEPKMFVT
jgi:urease accessory protein